MPISGFRFVFTILCEFIRWCVQVGELPTSGNGIPCESPPVESARNLKRSRHLNNASVLSTLKEDEHAGELMKVGKADEDKHRMSKWAPIDSDSVRRTSVSPRFGVPQGAPFLSLSAMAS